MSGSAGSELIDAETWINSVLTNDTFLNTTLGLGGRIYKALAPEDVNFPYVVFTWSGDSDVYALNTQGTGRMLSEQVFAIKIVSAADNQNNIKPLIDRIDQLFTVPTATITETLPDGSVWSITVSSRRDGSVDVPQAHKGFIVYQRGAKYKISVQSNQTTPPTGQ